MAYVSKTNKCIVAHGSNCVAYTALVSKGYTSLLCPTGGNDPDFFATFWPELDFRDAQTVWVIMSHEMHVGLSRTLVEEILEGFKENEEETE